MTAVHNRNLGLATHVLVNHPAGNVQIARAGPESDPGWYGITAGKQVYSTTVNVHRIHVAAVTGNIAIISGDVEQPIWAKSDAGWRLIQPADVSHIETSGHDDTVFPTGFVVVTRIVVIGRGRYAASGGRGWLAGWRCSSCGGVGFLGFSSGLGGGCGHIHCRFLSFRRACNRFSCGGFARNGRTGRCRLSRRCGRRGFSRGNGRISRSTYSNGRCLWGRCGIGGGNGRATAGCQGCQKQTYQKITQLFHTHSHLQSSIFNLMLTSRPVAAKA